MIRLPSDLAPRRWQRDALNAWKDTFRGTVRVVTGGGKTFFAYLCLAEFLRRHEDGTVVIVVPTLALLDQWVVDISDTFNISLEEIGCYWGDGRPEVPKQINVMVLNTARHHAPDVCERSTGALLIVDECHRAGSPENAKALQGNYEATLGLSATPERETDDGFEERVVPALGPIIFRYEYPDAKRDEVIVDFDLVNIEIAIDPDALLEVSQSSGVLAATRDELPPDKLKKLHRARASKAATHAIRVPWAVKLALAHRSERVVIFHERVESAEHIVALLRTHGQNSVAYHSKLSDAHRRDNLRLFRRGMVNVLVTCRALDEGTNVPEANVAIVAHSTKSTRQRIQRLGRVLRPAPGKNAATVFTLFRGGEEKRRLAEEAGGLEGISQISWKRGVVR